ncbi:MAG TPA: imidazole glycerol phosphate synthase subunit HisH [Novosphingobium sp.]|nr:imidazole glycerol phosphate synthase subunit HisH [Novosphingobium sp.]
MANKISVVDVGVGNIRSIWGSLQRLGAILAIAASPTEVVDAERLLLPGVGHFGSAMARLKSHGLGDALNEAVLVRRVPVLGICLGLQLMAKGSEEAEAPGLGWLDARVVRLQVEDRVCFKVPQIGWNTVDPGRPGRLLQGTDPHAEYYFSHSYHLDCSDARIVVATTGYGAHFPSVVEQDNIFGTQFHPEKSHSAGLAVLRNFLAV